MWSQAIMLQAPYNFEQVLSRLVLNPLNCVDTEEKMVKVPLTIHGEHIAAAIQETGTFERPEFIITAENMKPDAVFWKH